MRELLSHIFIELDQLVEAENLERDEMGSAFIPKALIKILGQTSLLAQPELTAALHLAQTGDLDAQLRADYFVKAKLKELLPKYGLVYDEDSPLIFIPKGSNFLPFSNLKNLEVVAIDPESALVSKAIKAPQKNLQLIREAIATDLYPTLTKRIIENGGDLKDFIRDEK
jgi:hypothetical protein